MGDLLFRLGLTTVKEINFYNEIGHRYAQGQHKSTVGISFFIYDLMAANLTKLWSGKVLQCDSQSCFNFLWSVAWDEL